MLLINFVAISCFARLYVIAISFTYINDILIFLFLDFHNFVDTLQLSMTGPKPKNLASRFQRFIHYQKGIVRFQVCFHNIKVILTWNKFKFGFSLLIYDSDLLLCYILMKYSFVLLF